MTSREIALIEKLAGTLPRSPLLLNGLCESDAELIRLPGTDVALAVTTDAIAEEIAAGLYSDPYLIGWMAVMVNASDLAAVGAEPLGILLNETLPADLDPAFIDRLQSGIRDALEACGLHLLGGDTNFSPTMQIAATAVGIVSTGLPLTRLGCAPGDRLYASAPLGIGSAFALSRIDPNAPAISYRPLARIREGRLLRGVASCGMDTSDGVVPTLDELIRLNRLGFRIDAPLADILHPAALEAAARAGLPEWLMLAGPHGEFELLFTVSPDADDRLQAEARTIDWTPIPIGFVTPQPGLWLGSNRLDSTRIRDLYTDVGGDAQRYLAELLAIDAGLSGEF
jgi:thiamine-monophosphate kinase